MRCASRWPWPNTARAESRASRRRPRRCRQTTPPARRPPRCSPARRSRERRRAAAQQRDADRRPGEQSHDPAVVAREDRGNQHQRDAATAGGRLALRGIGVEAGAPLHQPDRNPDHLAEKQRLGHGRGLQIEQIGIQREEGQRQRPQRPEAASGAPAGRSQRRLQDRPAPTESRPRSRWPTSCRPATNGIISRCGSGSHTEPSCVKPRLVRIEDPPRNVQMRNGVAVVEHRAVPPAPRNGRERSHRAAGQHGQAILPSTRRMCLFSQGASTRGRG